MIKLVIFDMDGTLLDTLQDLADSTNYVLRQHGYPEHPQEAYRYFVGNGSRILIERALPPEARNTETIEALHNEYIPYYEAHKEAHTAPYPGIIPLLQELKKRGILIAIASNKIEETMYPLTEYYFPNISFAAVMGSLAGRPIKPNPAMVEAILEKTGIAKSETLYVGDTGVDMQTAANAGLFKVGVLWGFRTLEELQQAGADAIIAEPMELLNLL
ncbi:HAD family hydrolase [Bacteroidales bacterium OttesenSCG-928-L19]|nr:HAD family hydrolase [Bacteroidales bacterium OttesenSCG-928-L19]